MCDYSITNVASRPAVVGDKLVTTNFGTGTRGFASLQDSGTAVCVLPDTELAFDTEPVNVYSSVVPQPLGKTAIFRQINREQLHSHHDALEFPDGQICLLTLLREGIHATVLQFPAQPKTEQESQEQRRVEVVG